VLLFNGGIGDSPLFVQENVLPAGAEALQVTVSPTNAEVLSALQEREGGSTAVEADAETDGGTLSCAP
jgi:hypothetical protein